MKPGDVLIHKKFVFADGTSANKYLIVLAVDGNVAVVAKTASQGRRYRNDHGCQAGSYFAAFLLTLGCCFFSKNTWICFSEFYELSLKELQRSLADAQVFKAGELDAELTRDVQFCAIGCDDISGAHELLIRAHF